MRILLLTHWLSNRGGGIPVVVAAVARVLADIEGLEVHVVGLVDLPDDLRDQNWGRATVHPVIPFEGRMIGYAPRMDEILSELQPDVVHLHGLWTYASIVAARWRKLHVEGRLIISPHGMLEQWALDRSKWKKRLAGLLFQKKACALADMFHALTPRERIEIEEYCGDRSVVDIPNGVDLPDNSACSGKKTGLRELLYLGRLHPKKNLEYLLELWAGVEEDRLGWSLRISGWDQAGTRARLEKYSRELGIADEVHFDGPQFGGEKDAAYMRADAFVLPSLSEGLPMVVLEAWSHALPVLMTSACNLPQGFSSGAAMELDVKSRVQGVEDLSRFLKMTEKELTDMGNAGFALVSEEYLWERVAAKFHLTYGWLLGLCVKPDFIDG